MTVYADIWITGGSRPLFPGPMGERRPVWPRLKARSRGIPLREEFRSKEAHAPFLPDQWLNRGWRGSASDRVLIQIFAYAGYKRGVHSRVQSSSSGLASRSSSGLLLDARLTSSERSSLRLASGLRCYESAHPGPWCRRRRRRVSRVPGRTARGPETASAGRSIRHPPL